ncbi:unnamed protein product [Paramecium pentaurelia]|uniref:Uncharacterized protein n=1 Tax=Paramecium pentaurelia TaxID=43138 RepID=A0A8S1SSS3_9CILI|nr:unnamed protein product [Paramecium pentaurelia]
MVACRFLNSFYNQVFVDTIMLYKSESQILFLLSSNTPKEIEALFYKIEDSYGYNQKIQLSILPFLMKLNHHMCQKLYRRLWFKNNYYWYFANKQIFFTGMLHLLFDVYVE